MNGEVCQHSAQSWYFDKKVDKMYCEDCGGYIIQDQQTGRWFKETKGFEETHDGK